MNLKAVFFFRKWLKTFLSFLLRFLSLFSWTFENGRAEIYGLGAPYHEHVVGFISGDAFHSVAIALLLGVIYCHVDGWWFKQNT